MEGDTLYSVKWYRYVVCTVLYCTVLYCIVQERAGVLQVRAKRPAEAPDISPGRDQGGGESGSDFSSKTHSVG